MVPHLRNMCSYIHGQSDHQLPETIKNTLSFQAVDGPTARLFLSITAMLHLVILVYILYTYIV